MGSDVTFAEKLQASLICC